MLKRTVLLAFVLTSCSYTGHHPPKPPSEVKVVKSADGWRLMVDGKPFFVKGMCLGLTKVGESASENTARDWMEVDDDHNGRNDFAYQAWVDTNRNNRKDPGEKEVGDFQLWKDLRSGMGEVMINGNDVAITLADFVLNQARSGQVKQKFSG